MNIKMVVHTAEEGGFWAEVPSIPGCVSQGETMDELTANIQDAVKACLSIDIDTAVEMKAGDKVVELAI